MSERKRNLIQLNLDKVAAHSPHGRLFVDKYQNAPTLAERQGLLYNAIANGFILNETDMASAIRALDNETFATSSRADKSALVSRAIQFFSGQVAAPAVPVSSAPALLTLADLERELLDDNGVLANADPAAREALISKVVVKYSGVPSLTDKPEAKVEHNPLDVPLSDSSVVTESEQPVVKDEPEASVQVVKRNNRVIKFRSN